MGAHLVSLALARWSHVSDRAFRVLMRMAVTALDEPKDGKPAAVYFAGHDLLAMTLRSGSRGGSGETVDRTVKRAVAELVAEGVVQRSGVARAGSNQVYRLNLNAEKRSDASKPSEGDRTGHPQRDTTGPPQGGPGSPEWVTPQAPPRNQEEPLEELWEEESVDLHADVAVARDPEPGNDPEIPVADDPPTAVEATPQCDEHGSAFVGGLRADGQPACPLCRGLARRNARPPDDPPPSGGGPPPSQPLADAALDRLPDPVPVGSGPQLRVLQGGLAA